MVVENQSVTASTESSPEYLTTFKNVKKNNEQMLQDHYLTERNMHRKNPKVPT